MPSRNTAKFKIGKTKSGLVWVLEVRGQAIARSAKTYQNAAAVRRAIEAFRNHAAAATIDE